ncbi:hypothetical protein [Sphingobium lignivorans]|uniref:Uncharacterized protein n=1 Tax=Sphingobium lignivorans TaxID=2735886 RepID=A0ABR6NEU0_9SPHN|nr:hypothetical protein [Sphingobium lignivorans]MBB5985799.1 hypothetical protein [Sphingobium lignivorans]
MPAFHHDDIVRVIPPFHRDVMLDLILAWAEVDVALKLLLSKVLNVGMSDGADLIGRMPASAVLAQIRKAAAANSASLEVLKLIRGHRRQYDKHAKPRNLIAHSKCVGYWIVDPNYLVFTSFEKTAEGELAVDRTPLEEMRRSHRWALAMTAMAMRIVDLN